MVEYGESAARDHVWLTLTPAAGDRLRAATAAAVGRRVAFTSNGKVVAIVKVVEPVGAQIAIDVGPDEGETLRIASALSPRNEKE
jgi:preprotein translocase subunit SecD